MLDRLSGWNEAGGGPLGLQEIHMASPAQDSSARRIAEQDAHPTSISSYFSVGIMAVIAFGMVVLQAMGGGGPI